MSSERTFSTASWPSSRRSEVAVVATAILLPLVLFVGFTQLGVPLTTFWLEF